MRVFFSLQFIFIQHGLRFSLILSPLSSQQHAEPKAARPCSSFLSSFSLCCPLVLLLHLLILMCVFFPFSYSCWLEIFSPLLSFPLSAQQQAEQKAANRTRASQLISQRCCYVLRKKKPEHKEEQDGAGRTKENEVSHEPKKSRKRRRHEDGRNSEEDGQQNQSLAAHLSTTLLCFEEETWT